MIFTLLFLLLLFVLTDDCVAKVAGEEERLGGEATQPKFRKYMVRRYLYYSDCSDSPTEAITTDWLSG